LRSFYNRKRTHASLKAVESKLFTVRQIPLRSAVTEKNQPPIRAGSFLALKPSEIKKETNIYSIKD
jgi:hypothetical protein